ncbi:ribonucrease Y [Brevinema andersonii]|uniref:Ribonuclease Y n=1 Tax=Brevinema andersonii TaxID=34097 RepID=A0A1I1DFW8_BREAD|nr:ribonuclease Y [Brevinema andersonii]SFB73734.1 ribonucrease Y [Brevinema andersonii]
MEQVVTGISFITISLVALIGIVIGYIVRVFIAQRSSSSAEQKVQKLLEDAEKQAESRKKEILLEAKDKIFEERKQFDKEYRDRQNDLQQMQRRLVQKEDTLDKKTESIEKKERHLLQKEEEVQKLQKELLDAKQEHIKSLEKVAGMTASDAKQSLIDEILSEAHAEAVPLIQKIEEEAREEADQRARSILITSLERNAVEVSTEKFITTVNLPSDDMKGRIIGREGRNIRSFESISGVDLIIDDTPEVVVISSFDPYRREIARIALEKLVQDGRIHPTRIEEVVSKVQNDINIDIVEAGKQACQDLKVNLPRGIYPYIGRLKYRTSYGQNVYKHSIEVANIAGMLAGELKIDVESAKIACLLHDIGKTIKSTGEGGHALLGAEIARKFGLPENIVNAIACHHGEEECRFIEGSLVMLCDAISAARPGARRESFDDYIKRLQQLEELSLSCEGVEKAYAIQAGREVRVFVTAETVPDERAYIIAREIAKKIEDNMQYPGQIKVTLIREMRVIEYAR